MTCRSMRRWRKKRDSKSKAAKLRAISSSYGCRSRKHDSRQPVKEESHKASRGNKSFTCLAAASACDANSGVQQVPKAKRAHQTLAFHYQDSSWLTSLGGFAVAAAVSLLCRSTAISRAKQTANTKAK